MKSAIKTKLQNLCERYEELSILLSSKEIILNQNKFKEYSKEYSYLEEIFKKFQIYQKNESLIASLIQLMEVSDLDLISMIEDEINMIKSQQKALEKQLQFLILPKNSNDASNVFLEIRAAAGGNESAIFAGDLYRMYIKFSEINKWNIELINDSPGDHGGFKEIIIRIAGKFVYSKLKFESGTHRVQRIPETEGQGRVHTSTCTVAIMPEVDKINEIKINSNDLRIDTYRASGAGGQHVNKTNSAIRITHISTGIVVECQDERSQHKNRAKAMALLQARLLSAEQEKLDIDQAKTRKKLIGTGDRSERIRTYNYPQGRITDHRINLTLYKLSEIMEGKLDLVITPLFEEYQEDLLQEEYMC